jgi:hypothetical protein
MDCFEKRIFKNYTSPHVKIYCMPFYQTLYYNKTVPLMKYVAHPAVFLCSPAVGWSSEAKFLVPDWGIQSTLSYVRPASLVVWRASTPESTISPSQGLRILLLVRRCSVGGKWRDERRTNQFPAKMGF